MGKENGSIYRPIDKIAGVSWGFIKLVCGRHKGNHPGLVLSNSSSGPHYQCESDDCSLTFPAAVHERLLHAVVKILNTKGSVIGYTWKKQIWGHIYSFEIYEYDFETGVAVGVNRLN